mmetsp:Transcript_19032/g.53272  ORF Transcript_19032/g.53272 Transcript_19032/m.53272 type:complete len:262 (-) Transcript_19032:349-1134(-)
MRSSPCSSSCASLSRLRTSWHGAAAQSFLRCRLGVFGHHAGLPREDAVRERGLSWTVAMRWSWCSVPDGGRPCAEHPTPTSACAAAAAPGLHRPRHGWQHRSRAIRAAAGSASHLRRLSRRQQRRCWRRPSGSCRFIGRYAAGHGRPRLQPAQQLLPSAAAAFVGARATAAAALGCGLRRRLRRGPRVDAAHLSRGEAQRREAVLVVVRGVEGSGCPVAAAALACGGRVRPDGTASPAAPRSPANAFDGRIVGSSALCTSR